MGEVGSREGDFPAGVCGGDAAPCFVTASLAASSAPAADVAAFPWSAAVTGAMGTGLVGGRRGEALVRREEGWEVQRGKECCGDELLVDAEFPGGFLRCGEEW